MTSSEHDNENSEEDLDEEQSGEDIDPDNVFFPTYKDTADVPRPTNFQAAIDALEAVAFRRWR